ncbi:MAG: YiiQ family protein, partial [Enterobacterales bacterium]|nr:YiiQ family protein [Enterobacterales bacterium]
MKKMSCYTSNKVFLLPILLLWATATTISFSAHAAADEKHSLSDELPAAPYLLPNAPTFDLTLVEFRSKYNIENPTLI